MQATASLAVATSLVPSSSRALARLTSGFDPSFGSATAALAALRAGAISSRELVAHTFSRIARHNPRINAFVTLLEEQASAQAARADEQRAKKRPLGALHGLPVLVKDSFATAGVRTTAGSKKLASYVPSEDAIVVARLKQAGAIVVGKTNLPEWAGDLQTYNDVTGQTNNPWDTARTPGGSTGGGAAALAAGMGFLEIGSDQGGSIRIPSHFCGVYGHKPTHNLVPSAGHIPPGLDKVPMSPLSVAGPLARSADDLQLQLALIAGPAGDDAIAYRVSLPKPRRSHLRDYKLGFVLDDPFCPLDAPVREVLAEALASLRKAGVQLTEGWPEGIVPTETHATYMYLLGATETAGLTEQERQPYVAWRNQGVQHPYVLGSTGLYGEWVGRNQTRLRVRAAWQRYFKDHDAFLMPTNFVAAIAHDKSPDKRSRQVATSGGSRSYHDQLMWIGMAALTGCPATVAPVGRTRGGLPVGMQIMGPYLEDATPIDIARKLAEACGSFVAPPAFV